MKNNKIVTQLFVVTIASLVFLNAQAMGLSATRTTVNVFSRAVASKTKQSKSAQEAIDAYKASEEFKELMANAKKDGAKEFAALAKSKGRLKNGAFALGGFAMGCAVTTAAAVAAAPFIATVALIASYIHIQDRPRSA